jgi:hypothetical protein
MRPWKIPKPTSWIWWNSKAIRRKEKEWSFAFNVARDVWLTERHPGMLQFGAKARLREKFNDANNSDFEDFGGDFTLADLVGEARAAIPSAASGRGGHSAPAGILFRQSRMTSNVTRPGFLVDSEGEDYALDEDVYAAYVMSEVISIGCALPVGCAWSAPRSIRLGARAIVDENNNDGIPTIEPFAAATATPIFPNLHLLYDFDEQWQGGPASPARLPAPTSRMPAPGSSSRSKGPKATTSSEWPRSAIRIWIHYTRTIVDLELSYYSPSGLGAASIGVFYKDIEDFFVATDIAGESPFEEFDEVAVVLNGGSANVWGVELAYVRELDFLPSPWDGLLIAANYAWIDSEAEVPFRDAKIPFAGAIGGGR